MQKFISFSSVVVPLKKENVDTDAIIPKQYLQSILKTGFGKYLFDGWRYIDSGNLETDVNIRRKNPDFILNDKDYKNAQILLTQKNFGCGSSREHAVWALLDYGFKVVIAPSFADIFFNNSFKNGLLLITLPQQQIDTLFAKCRKDKLFLLNINLQSQIISYDNNNLIFKVDSEKKHRLLEGLDDIDLILKHSDDVKEYENKRAKKEPWIFV
jgi:3-isopropylmalate/(R)-2-methylmalate dehydratase small subunit